MIRQLIFILTLLSTFPAMAQNEIHEKLYSRFLHDTVRFSVILPEGRDANERLPVLYALKYGMIDGPYIASQLRYFKNARYAIPNMIVVTVMADMDRIGFIYKTGLLTRTGLQFLQCLKNEIMPRVNRKYNTSGFNGYIGHSYAASYANYLVQHEPGIFNGYILLAPELAGMDFSQATEGQSVKSTFALDEKNVRHYNSTHTFYYAAVGEFDMARRHMYARNIVGQLKKLDSLHFFSKYDSIPRGDHTNILTTAIQPGLEFISQFFDPGMDAGPGKNAWETFKGVESRVKAIYGMEVEKNYSWYSRFAQLAIGQKDTVSLIKILEHFDTGRLKGYDTRTFGAYCAQAGLLKRAGQYYYSTISKILHRPEGEEWEHYVLSDCYWRLASEIEKDNPGRALEYLKKAVQLAEMSDVDMYFLAGRYLVNNAYEVKQGIAWLMRYLEIRKHTIDDIHWSYENVYVCVGKGYYLLKNMINARQYLEKALALNAENREAKALLAELKF